MLPLFAAAFRRGIACDIISTATTKAACKCRPVSHPLPTQVTSPIRHLLVYRDNSRDYRAAHLKSAHPSTLERPPSFPSKPWIHPRRPSTRASPCHHHRTTTTQREGPRLLSSLSPLRPHSSPHPHSSRARVPSGARLRVLSCLPQTGPRLRTPERACPRLHQRLSASLDYLDSTVNARSLDSFDLAPHPSTPPPSVPPATPAAMSTATANGDAGLKGAAPTGKQQFKPAAGGKALDGTRKQAGSPVDGQNRSVTPPMPSSAPWIGLDVLGQLACKPRLASASQFRPCLPCGHYMPASCIDP